MSSYVVNFQGPCGSYGEAHFDSCTLLHARAFAKALAPIGYDFLLHQVIEHDMTDNMDAYLRREFPDEEE